MLTLFFTDQKQGDLPTVDLIEYLMGSPTSEGDAHLHRRISDTIACTSTQVPPSNSMVAQYSLESGGITSEDGSDDDDDEDRVDILGEDRDSDSKHPHTHADDEVAHLTPKDLKRKREKRLEMNRASARERRKRKRMLLEKLEERVLELTKKNTALQDMNNGFIVQVQSQEVELVKAGNIISALSIAGAPRTNMEPAFSRTLHSNIPSNEHIRSLLLGPLSQNTRSAPDTIGRVSDFAFSEALLLAKRQQRTLEYQSHQDHNRISLMGNHGGFTAPLELQRLCGNHFHGSTQYGDPQPVLFGGLVTENTVSFA